MIVVRVELWPRGDSRTLRQIELLSIVNVGLGPAVDGRHTYEARRKGLIARLHHDQADGALVLVARAIDALAAGSEPDPLAAPFAEADLGLPEPSAVPSAGAAGGHRSRQRAT